MSSCALCSTRGLLRSLEPCHLCNHNYCSACMPSRLTLPDLGLQVAAPVCNACKLPLVSEPMVRDDVILASLFRFDMEGLEGDFSDLTSRGLFSSQGCKIGNTRASKFAQQLADLIDKTYNTLALLQGQYDTSAEMLDEGRAEGPAVKHYRVISPSGHRVRGAATFAGGSVAVVPCGTTLVVDREEGDWLHLDHETLQQICALYAPTVSTANGWTLARAGDQVFVEEASALGSLETKLRLVEQELETMGIAYKRVVDTLPKKLVNKRSDSGAGDAQPPSSVPIPARTPVLGDDGGDGGDGGAVGGSRASLTSQNSVGQLGLHSLNDPTEPMSHRGRMFFDAVEKNKISIVKCLLLENEGPPEFLDDDGGTLLHAACVHDRGNVVTLLLRAGVDVHAKNRAGQTALMIGLAKHPNGQAVHSMRAHLVNTNYGSGPVVDLVVQNERYSPLEGWSSKALFKSDPPEWGDPVVVFKPHDLDDSAPPGWVWEHEWEIDYEGADDDGWEYAFDFPKSNNTTFKFGGKGMTSFVRRRMWMRARHVDPTDPYWGVEEEEGAKDLGEGEAAADDSEHAPPAAPAVADDPPLPTSGESGAREEGDIAQQRGGDGAGVPVGTGGDNAAAGGAAVPDDVDVGDADVNDDSGGNAGEHNAHDNDNDHVDGADDHHDVGDHDQHHDVADDGGYVYNPAASSADANYDDYDAEAAARRIAAAQ